MIPLKLLVVSVLGWGGGGTGPVAGEVLDFTATWCGPCQQMSPIVSRLERQGYPIRKVDVDRERDLVRQYNVDRMPTFILVIDGVEQKRIHGAISENDLKALCGRIPRPPRGAQDIAVHNPEKAAVSRGKVDDKQPIRAPIQGDPLAASVRIRVQDAQGEDFGSGTVIDSRIGTTTILTCGHIFRNWDKQSIIHVDYFSDGRTETVVGRRVFHNLEDDVGLISVNVDPLPSCRVAPAEMNILKGTPVITVGCSGGEKPTVQTFKITALNRYLGADNIEVGGMPAQGRSGGGLFTKDGQLIGVCSGADSHYREGLYAGLKTVQAMLDRCQLANLYRSAGSAGREQNRLAGDPAAALANLDQADAELSIDAVVEPAETRQGATILTTKTEPRDRQPVAARGDAGEEVVIRDALEQAGEAEIVCIIRPVNQPRAASRVVILNRASRRFVEYLSDEMDPQPDIRETTLTAKGPRQTASVQKVERQMTSAPHGSSDKTAAAPEEDRPQPTGPRPYRRNRPERPLATATAAR